VLDLAEKAHVGTPVVAVNRRRDLWRFKKEKFTGKLPAWPGQAQLWKERAKREREAKRLAARGGSARRSSSRSSTRNRTRSRQQQRRYRSARRSASNRY
ncbi:MAG: hypothetical protein AAFR23_03665, partial [Pseudomonadota bacterium]